MSTDFLVEIGTEELPPKSLQTLSNAFRDGIAKGLQANDLTFNEITAYASPRRLTVLVKELVEQAPQKEVIAWGAPARIAFDEDGNPTKAAEAFARKNGFDSSELKNKVESDGKQDKLCHRDTIPGANITDVAADIIENALKALPIAKRMRWGASRREFVRPVKWIVILLGDQIIDAEVLGVKSGRTTRGHRIHCAEPINITLPATYLEQLKTGYVMANSAERSKLIRAKVNVLAEQAGGIAIIDDDLLAEVTALNEWPVPMIGRFDKAFLLVPPEALISSMAEHQKYFHVVDSNGDLMPLFITVANIESKDPAQVAAGNERVIRPRLADAAFFYNTDKKVSLEVRREKLQNIVFQAKLGTIFAKTERVANLAASLAPAVGANAEQARRAAELSKSDLVTDMVLEFDKLQGLMGRYYALHDGEQTDVAEALYEQYLPKFAGDKLPTTAVGTTLALADRIDTLVGIFGIGMTPTGSKDPFALRRASLGVLRLLVEKNISVDLHDVLTNAAAQFDVIDDKTKTVEQVLSYMLDRFKAWYEDDGIPAEVFISVAAQQLSEPLDIHQRVQAVHSFSQLPEASALAAANKRVSNILAKQTDSATNTCVDTSLLVESAEISLATQLTELEAIVAPLLVDRNYSEAMKVLAALHEPVDNFFDDVMVMTDDEALRNNRIALLIKLRNLFLGVADISLLVPAK